MLLLRRAFVGASIAWAAVLPVAAFAASRPHPAALVYACSLAIYAVGSAVCHQLPARSFFLWSAQMPVCARCTGIYVGCAIGVIAFRSPDRLRQGYGGPPKLHAKAERLALRKASDVRTVLALAALPTLLTLIYEWTTGVMPANWIRALAGVPLGAFVAWVVVSRQSSVGSHQSQSAVSELDRIAPH